MTKTFLIASLAALALSFMDSVRAQEVTNLNHTVVRFTVSTNGAPFGSLDIELFDQEKPATVRNFQRYVYGGAYSNLVLHRLVTNFVLQAGHIRVTNVMGNIAFNDYEPAINYGPITNEYSVGPELSNAFGTIAMARVGGQTNSASADFFFNLKDNPALDTVDGGFTVFGRVVNTDGPLRGTNLLQHFKTVPIRSAFIADTFETLAELPVNGAAFPAPVLADLFTVRATILQAPANLWPNPNLELDTDGNGVPDFWNKAGSDQSLAIWDTNHFVSGSRSLTARDASQADYGTWYSDRLPVAPGGRYTMSFKRRYDTTESMRFGIRYFSSSNTFVSEDVFEVSGFQPFWEQFTTPILVPNGATQIDIEMVTGGRIESIGTNWLDDISLSLNSAVTLVSTGSVWRYLANGSDQGSNWTRKNFDDTSWPAGKAQLGYGEGDEATVVSYGPDPNDKYITTYFRHSFAVQNASLFTNLSFRLLRDDGAVVYLNGVEVWRSNMPTNEGILYSTRAASSIGGSDETNFLAFETNATLLANGLNVLTVELHQNNTNSSDISFDLELTANVNFPPVVSINSPSNNAVYLAPATITIEASASDVDGSISKVEFYRDETKIGEATGSPYRITWSNVSIGDYALTAVAVDSANLRSTSSLALVTVSKETLFSVVATGSVWKYLDSGSNLPTNWVADNFDDSAWLSGLAQLGYGDGDESTVVGFGSDPENKFITTYFRHAFLVENSSSIAGLILRILRDDGAIVYLNGSEVFRSNMPTGTVSHLTLAERLVPGNASDENKFYVTGLLPGVLREGTNVFAIELHQGSASSSDVSFELALDVTDFTPAPRILVNGQYSLLDNRVETNGATIELRTTFPGGTIFYSLDGSSPSILYVGPFHLGQTTAIRAIAYSSNFVESAEAGSVQVTILNAYSVSATTSGGGTVMVDEGNLLHLSGSTVHIHATPDPGWVFLGWRGDGTGTDQSIEVPVTRAKCLEAVFGTPASISTVGAGSIAVSLPAILPYGFPLRLTAVPQAGNYFLLWANGASGTNNPLVYTVTNPNPTITAVFAALGVNRHALTVVPDGGGLVSVSPLATSYPAGQNVTLTAQAGTGQVFLGWSGSVSGMQNPLSVVMNQSRVITANFSRNPRLDVFQCAGQRSTEEFQLLVFGELGAVYRVDGTANLTNWMPLATLTNVLGSLQFNDPAITNLPHRFFRAVRE